ncbi:hypothetical protein HanRHA438_Chr14g0634271 [Helianthus annuus]|uniref:Uncharacterized protein n=1 Tax=Helianthus annuus TaxID=4232 RepID=A0A9K3E7G7_HELAN|nr:hypothetical protein HanXRQr2_Chr14g0624301 [Helianthus annuus]KAJ0462984.1 hypothetical protein HanHA300_Chr14g0510161 [Helianthus annuus]KAJ0484342.1 hypothetical protein HanHA89_Chr14g0543071 [Helianthus annuus]KAJ0654895.1 hypothetical protein HanLR1_Chr14g0512311 [Helianthus annuus]KAJ0838806.1 hypothetical protein HanPSC8_Chr14g0599151 [Helianthus annuus]
MKSLAVKSSQKNSKMVVSLVVGISVSLSHSKFELVGTRTLEDMKSGGSK